MSHSPPFTDEELVLLLDTYVRVGTENISADHPRVEWLSQVLRQLPIHPPEKRSGDNKSFRPPEELRRRLNELHRIENGTNPLKLRAYRAVWGQYSEDHEGLRAAAASILSRYGVEGFGDEAVGKEVIDGEAVEDEALDVALSYNRRMSSFYPDCEEAIKEGLADGRLDVPLAVEFEKEGGYKRSVRVRVDPDRPDEFWSDWAGSDPTRFPARIRAAATALRDHTKGGVFRIAHEDGRLTIEPLREGSAASQRGASLARSTGDDSSGRATGTQTEMGFGAGSSTESVEAEESFKLTAPSSERSTAERPARPEQSQFKKKLYRRYGARCAVCDIDTEPMLDACHLREKKNRGSDHSGNGLVLCDNHHRAYDNGLFAVEPGTLKIHLQDGLAAADIGVTRPSIGHLERPPHPEALQWRWAKWIGD